MNFFGAAMSLMVHFHHVGFGGGIVLHPQHNLVHSATSHGSGLNSSVIDVVGIHNTTMVAQLTGNAANLDGIHPMSWLQRIMLLFCIVSRGVLSGSVLKRLDAITKGLIDVTAIVLCTALQITIDTSKADGTALGIQGLMLLSILSYVL